MQSPTPICIYVTTESALCSYGYNMGILHTLGHPSLQCSLATVWEFAKFWNAKNKALTNAFFTCLCLPPYLLPAKASAQETGQRYKNKWNVKNEEWRILWNMLKNINSDTNYHLQGTIYRLIRSIIRWEVDALIYSLKRSTLMRWDEVASLRW